MFSFLLLLFLYVSVGFGATVGVSNSGWSLLGASQVLHPSEVFNAQTVKSVWAWDGVNKKWIAYAPPTSPSYAGVNTLKAKNAVLSFSATNPILVGSGYWINTTIADGVYSSAILNQADPKRVEQWYLDKLGLDQITGKLINQTYIQIVDDGFDSTHEDLKENYDESRSFNFRTSSSDPTSSDDYFSHGTMVAGIIGGRGFNGIGIRGVAPYSKISGYNILDGGGLFKTPNLEKAWFSGDGANSILVSNNSWGTSSHQSLEEEEILKKGSELLRDGKGRVYVMAAGNERETLYHSNWVKGNSNISNITNNQFVIAVAALKYNDTITYYSSPGSNILVSGYADGIDYSHSITTTTKNNEYTSAFSGTSAAAPMVSGIVGLVLEACPSLTYRDVKYLIATTANKIDNTNPTWVQNKAGLWHSTDYGYGVIDASEMLSVCKNNYTNLPAIKEINSTIFSGSEAFGYNNNKYFDSVAIGNTISKVEWIGVWFDFSHKYAGDIKVMLTSPSGTQTELLQSNNELGDSEAESEGKVWFRLSSQAFYDENPEGVWRVSVYDENDNSKNGEINIIKLQIIGH